MRVVESNPLAVKVDLSANNIEEKLPGKGVWKIGARKPQNRKLRRDDILPRRAHNITGKRLDSHIAFQKAACVLKLDNVWMLALDFCDKVLGAAGM